MLGFYTWVFKDSITGKILFKQYVKYETNNLYLSGIKEITRRGITIQSIVCDGRKGLFQLFNDIPVQICQFHQIQIVTRYLTRKPKSTASIELRAIALSLTNSSRTQFENQLIQWQNKHQSYFNERTVNPITNKSFYTHKRLRSAWHSLKRNLPWLFVLEENKELMINNTTNALDGMFADLKNKLRCHNGLSIQRKKKFIDGFFKA